LKEATRKLEEDTEYDRQVFEALKALDALVGEDNVKTPPSIAEATQKTEEQIAATKAHFFNKMNTGT
jgi:hypothetical protein